MYEANACILQAVAFFCKILDAHVRVALKNEINSHIDKSRISAIISANGSQIGEHLMSGYYTKQRRALLAFLEGSIRMNFSLPGRSPTR